MAAGLLPAGRERAPRLLVACSALLSCLLGVTVLAGWHAGNYSVVALRPDFPSMQYLTACGFAVCGIGLLLHAFGWLRGLTVVCGGFVAFGALAVLAQYLTGANLGFQFLLAQLPRMPGQALHLPSPPTAVAFALCGTGIALLGMRLRASLLRLAIWGLGTLGLTLSAMVLVGYASGLKEIYIWGDAIGMALHTASGLIVLNLGLLASLWQPGRSILVDRWLPAPVALGTGAATLLLWQSLVAERQKSLQDRAGIVAQSLATNTSLRLGGAVRALERMKSRWENRGGTPREEWEPDAASYIRDEEILASIEWVGTDWRIQWVLPSELAARRQGADVRLDTRWPAAALLERASRTRAMTVSPRIPLTTGGDGYNICLPLFPSGRFDGFLIATINLQSLLAEVLNQPMFADYSIAIFEGNSLLSGSAAAPEGARPSMQATADFHDRQWLFVVVPRASAFVGLNLATLVLCLGWLLAFALAAAVRAYQLTLWRGDELRATNERLTHEIAERQAAERHRLDIEERLRVVLASATGVSVVSTDPAGLITFFSHGSERMLGYEASEMVARETPAVFHDPEEVRERAAQLSSELGRTIEGFETFVAVPRLRGSERREWTYVCKDGTRRAVELTVTVLRDIEGGIVGFLGTAMDITERKEMEAGLHAATARAEAQARAKAEFLANMSHEIRTPLNAVIGMSELLMDSSLDAHDRELVETIHASGDVLLGLISDILDFSKIESGQVELEHIPVNLRDCVESALDLVATPAARKRIELVAQIDPALPASILGDPTRLRQVFVNLLGNAIKFTDTGEVLVRLSLVEGGESLRLYAAVRDSGIGIPADRIDRLFHAFSQVDASTTRRYGGTGLGLAISQRIVQKMGGRIWVESQPGAGSTFQFEIPLHPVGDAAGETSLPTRELAGLTALVVDDNATSLAALQMQLEARGMHVTAVATASAALQALDSDPPFAVALLDSHLGEEEGSQLAEAIHARHGETAPPILLLSPLGERAAHPPHGISEIVTKPIHEAALLQAILRALGREPAPSRRESSALEHFATAHPLRILVAEDNPVNQRVTLLLLQRLGYEARIVCNGRELLETLETENFDVVLIDVQMPEIDGLSAAQEICHRHPPERRPWMIALTANATEGDEEVCLAAGMHGYLSKPLRGALLEAALASAWHARHPESSPA
jgi:PAS domain S-box-containing protein